jgi:uncharacterized protein (TIGR03086 family)
MDAWTLHRRAVEEWLQRVAAVGDDQWTLTTPCVEWDVRALVNHVVGEELWTRPLVEGSTVEEVGDRFDGDVLGEAPQETAVQAGHDAAAAMDERGPRGERVHLSFGETPIGEYAMQLTADHLIHGWDLAAATGQDRTLDADLVAAVATWFAGMEELYRGAGAIGPRAGAGGDAQTDLLAAFGRDASWVT